jgi:predicted dehydrogenase
MLSRRGFLQSTVAAAGAASLGVAGANDRVIVGVMGIRDRGMDLASELAKRDDVEVRYLADPDSRLFEDRAKHIESIAGTRPRCIQDYRRILDDPEVDAVAMATPDHWHALGTVQACQAGKDVYVEKPTSHSIWESRKMVEAARTYERVVQVGTQNRSAEYIHAALEYLQSGSLGDIHWVRILNSKLRERLEPKPDAPAPEGVDYDLWLGPAPERPFNENHFHYQWHWFWDYGGGDLINDGVHQMDLARWLTGQTLPTSVSAMGGLHVLRDGRETPDTQAVQWEFPNLTMTLEQTLWTPYMKKVAFELREIDSLPRWPFAGTHIQICGTRHVMYLARMGGGWQIFDADGESVAIQHGRFAPANTKHMANFVDCIRSRERPAADIEEGHYSTLMGHYGNIAYRVGRRLTIDPETEGFVDDAEANALVKRRYRPPYVIPDQV